MATMADKPLPPRCKERVTHNNWPSRCQRDVRKLDDGSYATDGRCRTHSPEAEAKRRAAYDARRKAEIDSMCAAARIKRTQKARADQFESLFAALENLVRRCDGDEGVRADGSNIDTCAAHAALEAAEGIER